MTTGWQAVIERCDAGLAVNLVRVVAVPAAPTTSTAAPAGLAFALRLGRFGVRGQQHGLGAHIGINGFCTRFLRRLGAPRIALRARSAAAPFCTRCAAAFTFVVAWRALIGTRRVDTRACLGRHGHGTLGPIAAQPKRSLVARFEQRRVGE